MKVLICCSKYIYNQIPEIKKELESHGHQVSLPNSYDDPMMEEKLKEMNFEELVRWKGEMLRKDKENIIPVDAILILNKEKKGQPNYIGAATFLEMHTAFSEYKKIFLYNPIPENMLKDELIGMNPTIINQDLTQIK